MKKKGLIFILSAFSALSLAQENNNLKNNYGYSYITFGVENVTYKETFPGANSKVSISSPILNTGGLYRINDTFDFSIDALATFSPQSSVETWASDGGSVYQENNLEYMKAATNILVHYKLTPTWRIITGPSLTYQTYTRSDKNTLDNSTIDTENDVYREGETWEESSTDIYLDVGIAYDTGTLYSSNSKWHQQIKVAVGVPLWSQTENSRFSGTTFNDTGYRAYVDSSISYKIFKGLHLGWYIQYAYEKRFEADPQTVYYRNLDGELQSGQGWLPEADTYSFSTGLQVLWKL